MQARAQEILSGTLRLRKKIADGGMGSVFVAEHLVLGNDVAVKIMAKPWASVPSARTRFLREARITASISSPHIVRVLDCRLDEADEPYLVLELLHGENLAQRVARNGALSVFDVEEVITQTAKALEAVHAARIVHRDVKPENVFLVAGKSPLVKLLDFGIAKPMRADECIDADHLPAGTPQYMSPEQLFEPETADARSDLFSLGAVAYFALTGHSPFEAESLEAQYIALEHGRFARPTALRAELSEEIDRWFEKALARNADDRFQNAREMAAAFHEAVHAPAPARTTLELIEETDELSPTELAVPITPLRSHARTALAMGLAAAAAIGFVFLHDGFAITTAVASPPSEISYQDAAPADAVGPLASARSNPAAVQKKPAAKRKVSVARTTAALPPAPTADPVEPAALDDILDTVPNPNVAP
jgi:eukaryotic-like serine/threonine-protein kinase